jgi:hypothetical protein
MGFNQRARQGRIDRPRARCRAIVGDGPLLRELHPTKELCKSRIGMKIVEISIGFDRDQTTIMRFIGFLQPFK